MMEFFKYSGAGNDFILVNNMDLHIPAESYSDLAKDLCRQHFSVGADGMMFVEPPTMGGDIKMVFYNRDGTKAEMCGNGARCICRYAHDAGLSSGDTQTIETTAGIVTGKRIDENHYRIQLNTPSVMNLQIQTEHGVCDYVELGNPGIPHAVVEVEMPEDREALRPTGLGFRFDSAFPKGANINMCSVIGEDVVRLVTYERGVEDFTYACGTGTGSVVAALTLRGRVSGKNVRVITDGAELSVDIVKTDAFPEIYLTGPADLVFTGVLAE